MEFRQFASPHVHPQSLDSASTPAAFAAREVALGGVALTCTDHGTLQASHPIYEITKKGLGKEKVGKGLVPIVGLEAYFRDDDDVVLKRLGVERTVSKEKWAPKTLSYADYLKYMHLTMHFRDHQAYLTAVRLLSKADFRAEQHGTERKPLFAWSDIEEIAATNATIGSGCLIGMVSRHLLQHQDRDAADAYFERLHHLFGDRLYVELFPHVCSHNWSQAVYVSLAGAEGTTEKFYFGKNLRVRDADHPGRAPVEVKADGLEAVVRRIGEGAELVGVKHNLRWTEVEPRRITGVRAEKGFIQNDCSPAAPEGDVQWGVNMYQLHLAEKYGVRVLVSDDSHFATRDEHPVQDIRLSSPHHTWKMHNSYHRYSSAEAWDYFRDRMGVDESTFRGWIDNSLEWAEGFRGFKFDSEVKLPTNFYPEDSLRHTAELISAHGRMSDDDAYRARLATEIELLHDNGTIDYLPYFMIDEEVVRVYRNQGWLTGPGRGSAAGLYLSNLLGITHVDPLRYKLSLERFITPDRIAAKKSPDIDQDLPFREPLEGWEVDVVEFTAEDGTTHVLPEVWKLETPEGLLTVDEAVAKDVPVYVWWRKSDRSAEKLTVLRRSRTDKALPRWFPGWFKERFGDHIAQISVDSTLKLRAAVRDVARQRHGFVPADVEELVKQFAEAPQGLEEVKFVLGYSDDQGEHAGSIATDKALQTYAARYPEDFKLVTKCLGLARHRSQHPCLPAGERILIQGEKSRPRAERLVDIVNCDGKVVYTGQTGTKKRGRWPSGEAKLIKQPVAEVREYTLSDGRTFRCTPNHQILTVKGWLAAEQAFAAGVELVRPVNRMPFTERGAEEYAARNGGRVIKHGGPGTSKTMWECVKGHRWEAPRERMFYYENWCKRCSFSSRFQKTKTNVSIESLASRCLATYRRHDKKYGRVSDVDLADVVAAKNGLCVYCSRPATGLERVDNSIGHTKANCVIACLRCNWMRGRYVSHEVMLKVGALLKEIDP